MRIISENEVQSLPRGRTADYNGDLLDALGQISEGNFGVLDEEYGAVVDSDPAKQTARRQAVAGEIRKHWAKVFGTDHPCSVKWSPEGYAQVGNRK